MDQYCGLLQQILNVGHPKADRTGTGTLSFFGAQLRFDLQDGFPMVTTKKLHLRSIIHELLWFLNGDTNIQYLNDNGVTIWDEWSRDETRHVPCVFTVEERAAILRRRSSINGKTTDWYNEWEKALLEGDDDEAKMEVLDAQNVPREGTREVTTHGELGPIYGKQWREWTDTKIVSSKNCDPEEMKKRGYKEVACFGNEKTGFMDYVFTKRFDQIQTVIDQLRNDPDNRRIIVSAWNVGELDQMALAPCHSFFQFYTREMDFEERESWFFDNHDHTKFNDFISELNRRNLDRDAYEGERYQYIVENTPERILSCQLYQRSADCFLGVPFNIASYALLIHMVAQQVNMVPGEFIWTGGDVHIYSNHMEQVKEQLTRKPLPLPKLVIKRKPDSIFDYKFEDFEIQNYQSHPAIKAPVAI